MKYLLILALLFSGFPALAGNRCGDGEWFFEPWQECIEMIPCEDDNQCGAYAACGVDGVCYPI